MSRLPTSTPLRGMRLLCILSLAACHGTNGPVLTDPDAHGDTSTPSAWTLEPGNTTVDLLSVWAGSASQVIAVGISPGDALNPGIIDTYDGTTWSPAPYLLNLYGVFGRTAVGDYGLEASVMYRNGTTWSSRDVIGTGELHGTWESSPGTYGVGDNGKLFYTSETGIPGSWGSLTTNTSVRLYAVWGATPSDVYAVGEGGVILHNTNAGPGGSGTWVKTTHGSSNLRAIWGSSTNDIYIVGEAPAVILHSTNGGASWTETTPPVTAIGLYGVGGRAANDVYIVGATGGVALHSTGNDAWTTEPLPNTFDLFGLSAAPSGDLYAVGRRGTIIHQAP